MTFIGIEDLSLIICRPYRPALQRIDERCSWACMLDSQEEEGRQYWPWHRPVPGSHCPWLHCRGWTQTYQMRSSPQTEDRKKHIIVNMAENCVCFVGWKRISAFILTSVNTGVVFPSPLGKNVSLSKCPPSLSNLWLTEMKLVCCLRYLWPAFDKKDIMHAKGLTIHAGIFCLLNTLGKLTWNQHKTTRNTVHRHTW